MDRVCFVTGQSRTGVRRVGGQTRRRQSAQPRDAWARRHLVARWAVALLRRRRNSLQGSDHRRIPDTGKVGSRAQRGAPDGRSLAMPLTDGVTTNIWTLSTSTGQWRQVTDFDDRPLFIARRVSWSADGQSLLAAIAKGTRTSSCSSVDRAADRTRRTRCPSCPSCVTHRCGESRQPSVRGRGRLHRRHTSPAAAPSRAAAPAPATPPGSHRAWCVR